MKIDAHVDALLEVGRSGNFEAAAKLPGAGVHSQVVLAASLFRGAVIERVASLSIEDRVALAKATAVYENSVGGIGSVTGVQHVMRLPWSSKERGYETFHWICEHTRSLWCYADRAVEFIEPEVAALRRALARAEVEQRNYKLAAPVRARRAERATANLYNAVRRGDVKAVHALLQTGADPTSTTPTGESLISYARSAGRDDIACQLEATRNARSAA
jgi:hypothetical protein